MIGTWNKNPMSSRTTPRIIIAGSLAMAAVSGASIARYPIR
jgi:hypothetical protein